MTTKTDFDDVLDEIASTDPVIYPERNDAESDDDEKESDPMKQIFKSE